MENRYDEGFWSLIDPKEKWAIFGATITPHLNYVPIWGSSEGVEKLCPGFGFDTYITFYSKSGNESAWALAETFIETQYKRILENPKMLVDLHAKWEIEEKNFYTIENRLEKNGITDLKKDYVQFLDAYKKEYAPALILEYFYAGTEYMAKQVLEKYSELKKEMVPAIASGGISFLAEEKKDLLKLVLKFQKNPTDSLLELKENNPKLFADLQQHQKKYFWMQNNYKYTNPISLETFFSNLVTESKKDSNKLEIEIKEIDSYASKQKNLREKLHVKMDVQSQKTVDLVAMIAHWHDRRKRAALVGSYYLNVFLKQAAEKYKIDFELLQFTTPEELISLLDGNALNEKELRERMNGCVQIGNRKGVLWTMTGKPYEKLKKMLMPSIDTQSIYELRGMTVSVGEAKGIARVVKQATDHFEKGEILVTSMTRPEFVPLMKKAAGIITDEGGMTSHAAVLSREFNIPCIVGTKVATKVIESGMEVELRTNHGTIKLLSKKK